MGRKDKILELKSSYDDKHLKHNSCIGVAKNKE